LTDENITPDQCPPTDKDALAQMHILWTLITPSRRLRVYIHEVEVPIAKTRNQEGEVLIAPVLSAILEARIAKWADELERLPHKLKSWADIRRECHASAGEYDLAIQPLRDGIWKLG